MSPATAPPTRDGCRVTAGSVAVAVIAVIAWEIASHLSFVIPEPLDTFLALGRDLGDPRFLAGLRETLLAALAAFVLAMLIGGPAGLGLGLSRRARVVFSPIITMLNGIPKIVLYPVLLPVFHLGYGSKIVMGLLFGLFPVLINTAAGVREIPDVYWRLARSLRATRWQTLTRILLPAIRGPLLTGVRLAVSLSLVGVVLSEFFATERGLGRIVLSAYSSGDYAGMVSTILLLIAISFALSLFLWRLERRVR
ncbi:ABC transporter permease [Bailinhaonella thermotolerans]|uniref:ABC transporter permease subunit n=1 Tax=Bailinhaonella thermotolerans TaxID=1070861 RepID=A0A3A4BAA1_9ACTN|nr:ABC transporter permease subunit [Bailinhaonella thermotolerans]RJL35839.1 ABC transporter permease subunit [Bailinhaonella thermotolerans]